AIDLRTLALFRVTMALTMLLDLALRAQDLTLFYTDDGVLTRRFQMENLYEWQASLHFMSGEPLIIGLLFVLHAVILLALLVGYRTRIAMVLAWFFMLSLQNRNQVILQNSDVLLACL